MVDKVIATEGALELVEFLKQKHDALMFHQSGGCGDGSAANCYLPGEIPIGGCPFYIGKSQYGYWKYPVLPSRANRCNP